MDDQKEKDSKKEKDAIAAESDTMLETKEGLEIKSTPLISSENVLKAKVFRNIFLIKLLRGSFFLSIVNVRN